MMTEDELWYSYSTSRRDNARNAIFEHYWPWAKNEAKIRIHAASSDAHSDEILSSLSLEILSTTIPRFPPQTDGNHFRSRITAQIGWHIADYIHSRRQTGVTRKVRQRLTSIHRARGTLANQLGRSPADAELASFMAVPEAEIIRIERLCSKHPVAFRELTAKPISDDVVFEESIEPLPERLKPVMRLHYLKKMGLREIADVVGLSFQRVGQILSEGRSLLGG